MWVSKAESQESENFERMGDSQFWKVENGGSIPSTEAQAPGLVTFVDVKFGTAAPLPGHLGSSAVVLLAIPKYGIPTVALL